MKIGVPKELKDHELRVGLTPDGAGALAADGHEVIVEHGAGVGCGFADADYVARGAQAGDAAAAWKCDLVVKVKEPIEAEYGRFAGQILFTYLHLAGAPPSLTRALLASDTTGIAYETVEDDRGRLPLLAPMSAIAGSMAPLVGAYYLAASQGGRGTLLGTVLGERHGEVTIVGDGIVGRHACDVASALGTRVEIFGITPERAPEFERPGTAVRYVSSTPDRLARRMPETDLLIGAVLNVGARSPHVVTEAMVASMPRGSVIVDVSIDQGGCVATSRPTTHSNPTFVAHGVTHYCVTNMPGAYPRTATLALTAATLPYVRRIAAGGLDAVLRDPRLAQGVNTRGGFVTYAAVADALGLRDRYREIAAISG
jgi:alanine dehydrogenase